MKYKLFSKYFIFLFLIKIEITYNQSCKTGNTISNNECFNNIIKFSDKRYRAGAFAKNKNGDIVIEYSSDASRLFYGLRKDGKYFFNKTSVKVIENIKSDGGLTDRFESQNIFVSLEDDINKDNQYLLSISTYQTLVELHNLQNDEYAVRQYFYFIGKEVYSFRFSLLEAHINNKNIYFCVYIPKNDTQTIVYSIKKFGFTGFTLTTYDAINNSQFYNILLYRIQSCFIIDEEEIIVVFFINTQENLAISYFDFDLGAKGQNQQICQLSNTFIGTGIFFKSIYL